MTMKEDNVFSKIDEAIERLQMKNSYNSYSGRCGLENWRLDIYNLKDGITLAREETNISWPKMIHSGENPEYREHFIRNLNYYIFDNGKPVLDEDAIKENVKEITGKIIPSLGFEPKEDFFSKYSTTYLFVNSVENKKGYFKVDVGRQPSNKELREQSSEACESIDALAEEFGSDNAEKFAKTLPELRKNASRFSKKISLA
jgi:hypothetical protein